MIYYMCLQYHMFFPAASLSKETIENLPKSQTFSLSLNIKVIEK